jgi:hypothetical protein
VAGDAVARADAQPGIDAALADDAAAGMDAVVGSDAADGGTVTPDDAAMTAGDASTPSDSGTSPGSLRPVDRGGMYFGFTEQFNRYYTDPTWVPMRTVYVSSGGTGDGSSAATPAPALDTPSLASPGTRVVFLAGAYADFCIEVGDTESGTYDDPILLEAERDSNGARLVHLECCGMGRNTCINFENASYVAVVGFEMSGGNYGVRSVGSGYDASEHARGIAALECDLHDQSRDPILTGASDWGAWEGNLAHGAGNADGHGIYLSNGSDWNIVRNNELWDNASSDFQINADPESTCADEGIELNDPLCDDYAGLGGEGGRGASDYIFVENNFFHHGNAQGANFTSVRRSVVRNNIFAFYARHGVSFWQETDNEKLGSADNKVLHNLFVSDNRQQMIQFIEHSTRNEVANNVFVGTTSNAVFMETDATVADNTYAGNYYLQGSFDGDAPHVPGADEHARPDFDPTWFTSFPAALARDPEDYRPSATAPFLGFAAKNAGAPTDRTGAERTDPTDPGPFESP